MTTSVVKRGRRRSGRWWASFTLGALAGVVASALLHRAGRRSGATGATPTEERWRRWSRSLDEAFDEAAGGLATVRRRLLGAEELDETSLGERLAGLRCGDRCRVLVLGDGIVEVVGACDSDAVARTLLDAVAEEPGVEVVVNRIWTPASDDPAPVTSPVRPSSEETKDAD